MPGELVQGAPGPRGQAGTQGPTGSFTTIAARFSTRVTVRPKTSTVVTTAECQPGETAIAGGFDFGSGHTTDIIIKENYRFNASSWRLMVAHGGATDQDYSIRAQVICAT